LTLAPPSISTFTSVPANSAEQPLEKHYVSHHSRSQKGILVFLARDSERRVLRYMPMPA
jgi:hypothetical protein